MEFKELMGQFAATVGITDASADEMGAFHFAIDDMTVSLEADEMSGEMVTYAQVGELPPEGREHLYRLMMESMFRGEGTDGATLSIAHDSDTVYLHRIDPLAVLDIEKFKSNLERFVNALEAWRNQLVDFCEVIPAVERAAAAAEEERRTFESGEFMQV